MRFRTRAFLLSLVPFALLLCGSFLSIEQLVQSTVRSGLRDSLRQNHLAIARLSSRSDLQSSRFLRIVGENAALKAGLQLLLGNKANPEARRTVEDQLRELCDAMGFDLLMASDSSGAPLAAVWRSNGQAEAIDPESVHAPKRGLMTRADKVYQIASVAIDQGNENLGTLSVGEPFDLAAFTTPAVLLHDGKLVTTSMQGVSSLETEKALRGCPPEDECNLRLGGQSYISLPLQAVSLGDGYVLRSLQNVDAASGPVKVVLNHVFLTAGIGALLAALVFSALSAQSMVGPIAAMTNYLKESERTGVLPEFHGNISPIREIQQLTSSFNQAAGAIREGRDNLHLAYVGFVGSLASALDARDKYTAGHSQRVSDLSCATAAALGIDGEELEEIRIGALLHDIGKIGIPDAVLQKDGRLTDHELAIVKAHPEIGRRILDRVSGFAPYLNAVELHHENWDGSGYPWGKCGGETPIAARIIHVSDAYDAMTTDRPYRRGMSHEAAIAILGRNAGTQFDPAIVEVFSRITARETVLCEVVA